MFSLECSQAIAARKATLRLRRIAIVADRLAKLGCRVLRESPKLPDLARTTRTYGELLAAVYSLDLSPDDRARIDAAAKALSPEDQTLAAYRLRGISANHSEWIRASRVRATLRGQWFDLFREIDIVLCPPMPSLAFPHDHTPERNRQLDVDGTKIPSQYNGWRMEDVWREQ